ncbi:MAG TPA: hypothetical protein DCM86_02570, partial [Verrucomicrobiales bacterium]|nr:hypothetical protein [Verrucomicrobiales bacterium]
MKPLTELVEELRRELSIALAGEAGRSADGVPLTLRKATLTLQIAMAEKPPHPGGSRLLATLIDRTPVENGATHPLQTLTLEYQVGSGGLPEPATPPAIAQGARGQATPEQLLQELRRVLGEPGFDSAARATVLCETLEGRPRQEVEPILASLDGKPGGPEAP